MRLLPTSLAGTDVHSEWTRPGAIQMQETHYTPGERMRSHAHEELCISILLRGGVTESSAGRTTTAHAAWVGVKPPDLLHRDTFADGATHTLKLRIAVGLLDELERYRPAVTDWRWVPPGAAARAMLRLLRRLRDTPPDAAWVEESALDVIGALAPPRRARRTPPAWVRAAREELLAAPERGVIATDLAARLGVHPVTLARGFRQCFGESMSDCVRRARAAHAARLLTESETPITEVALRAGFADQSHLTRTFRQELDTTPAAFRLLSRAG